MKGDSWDGHAQTIENPICNTCVIGVGYNVNLMEFNIGTTIYSFFNHFRCMKRSRKGSFGLHNATHDKLSYNIKLKIMK